MTPDERLMLAQQGAADPELAGCDVHRPAIVSAAEAMRDLCVARINAIGAAWGDSGYGSHWAAARILATEVYALPLPADPRDAETATLRAALTEIEDATRAASGYLDVNRATVWRVNDIARAALAQSAGAK